MAAGAARPTEDRSADDLAVRIAAGDARAFERLYALHRAEISRYCATMVRNPQDAEEAFQLTMLAAYRALSAGRGPRGRSGPGCSGSRTTSASISCAAARRSRS